MIHAPGIAAGNARCDSDQTGHIDYTEPLGAVLLVGTGLFAHRCLMMFIVHHSSGTEAQGSYTEFFQQKRSRSTVTGASLLRNRLFQFFTRELWKPRGDQEESLKEMP